MRTLDNFILATPYLFLKKIPYAWFMAVIFWSTDPVVAVILAAATALGLLAMLWQEHAWRRSVLRDFNDPGGKFFMDRPRAPLSFRVRNLALLFLASAGLAWLLDGVFTLFTLQWFFLLAGVMLLYKDTLLLGAYVTFLVTGQGLAIRFVPGGVDYRILIRFNEIREARLEHRSGPLPPQVNLIAPLRSARSGLHLLPANPHGFTRGVEELFLVPAAPDLFLGELRRYSQRGDL